MTDAPRRTSASAVDRPTAPPPTTATCIYDRRGRVHAPGSRQSCRHRCRGVAGFARRLSRRSRRARNRGWPFEHVSSPTRRSAVRRRAVGQCVPNRAAPGRVVADGVQHRVLAVREHQRGVHGNRPVEARRPERPNIAGGRPREKFDCVPPTASASRSMPSVPTHGLLVSSTAARDRGATPVGLMSEERLPSDRFGSRVAVRVSNPRPRPAGRSRWPGPAW